MKMNKISIKTFEIENSNNKNIWKMNQQIKLKNEQLNKNEKLKNRVMKTFEKMKTQNIWKIENYNNENIWKKRKREIITWKKKYTIKKTGQ